MYNVDRTSAPVAKTDYAANGGSLTPCPCVMASSLAQGDDHSMYMGYDQDTTRWAYAPPGQMIAQDRPGRVIDGFGSAHSSGLCAAMCDGSVHVISFSVDHQTFVNLCNRGDGQAVAVGAF